MSSKRRLKRFREGKNSLYDEHKHNNRKATPGRKIQCINLKDEDGNYIGRTRFIRHSLL